MATAQAPVPVAKVRLRLERTRFTEFLVKGRPSFEELIVISEGQRYRIFPAIWPGLFVVVVPKGA